MAESEGFHTTTFPIKAGAPGRLPAIAVKLNGVTAYTKPSRGRYSTLFHTPGELCAGCCAYNSSAYCTLNLKKSTSSAAESISACQAFFPCPNIVAAIISYLYFPDIKSAAFK